MQTLASRRGGGGEGGEAEERGVGGGGWVLRLSNGVSERVGVSVEAGDGSGQAAERMSGENLDRRGGERGREGERETHARTHAHTHK